MSCRTHRLLLAGVIGVAASSSNASAQVVRSLTASAIVPDIGVVLSVSSLQWSESQADESTASGTVSTKHNGPYLLQVRLTTAHPDTVMARRPDGTYAILDVEWTTVASRPRWREQAELRGLPDQVGERFGPVDSRFRSRTGRGASRLTGCGWRCGGSSNGCRHQMSDICFRSNRIDRLAGIRPPTSHIRRYQAPSSGICQPS